MISTQFKTQFTDGNGKFFVVSEVLETPVGLTVYYSNLETGDQYSCLLEAFGQRFIEVQIDAETIQANSKSWSNSQRCCG